MASPIRKLFIEVGYTLTILRVPALARDSIAQSNTCEGAFPGCQSIAFRIGFRGDLLHFLLELFDF